MTTLPVTPHNDNDLVFIQDDKITTTSLKIAAIFNKRHSDLIRAIRNLGCSEEFTERNFAFREEIQSHKTGASKTVVCDITRDGFTILVMGFTGKQAMKWKEAYIKAFNEMEKQLQGEIKKLSPYQLLKVRHAVQRRANGVRANYQYIYRYLHCYFGVNSYKNIPASKFEEALENIEAVNIALFENSEKPGISNQASAKQTPCMEDLEKAAYETRHELNNLEMIFHATALLVERTDSAPLKANFKFLMNYKDSVNYRYEQLEELIPGYKPERPLLEKPKNIKAQILNFIHDSWHEKCRSYTERSFLSEFGDWSETTVKRHLKELIESGKIQKRVSTRSGQRFLALQEFEVGHERYLA